MTILQSTTALTIARDTDGRQRYLYRGQTVDAAALDADDAKRLLKLGHLAEYDAPASEEAGAKAPTTADEIVAAVGDDVDQAKSYLAAENAKARPRAKLVAALEGVIAGGAS